MSRPILDRMGAETKTTWDEMKTLYPDQWLEIVDFETDKFGDVASGVVVAHGASISDFPPPPSNRRALALQYTGESSLGDGRISPRFPSPEPQT